MPKRVPARWRCAISTRVGRSSPHERSIAGVLLVAIDRVKEPQRGVSCVVQAFALSLGKHVRDEPVADVKGKRPEDVTRLGMPAREERQSFEADHRVAAPVGEPVIAGDDRARFASAARARAPRRLCRDGPDDELIGPEHELGGNARARRRVRPRRAPRAAIALGRERVDGIDRRDDFPGFCRGDQCDVAARCELGAKVARAPQRPPTS